MKIDFRNLNNKQRYFLITSVVFLLFSITAMIFFGSIFFGKISDELLTYDVIFIAAQELSLFFLALVVVNCTSYCIFAFKYCFAVDKLKSENIFVYIYSLISFALIIYVLINSAYTFSDTSQSAFAFYHALSLICLIFYILLLLMHIYKWISIIIYPIDQVIYDYNNRDTSATQARPAPKQKKVKQSKVVYENDYEQYGDDDMIDDGNMAEYNDMAEYDDYEEEYEQEPLPEPKSPIKRNTTTSSTASQILSERSSKTATKEPLKKAPTAATKASSTSTTSASRAKTTDTTTRTKSASTATNKATTNAANKNNTTKK